MKIPVGFTPIKPKWISSGCLRLQGSGHNQVRRVFKDVRPNVVHEVLQRILAVCPYDAFLCRKTPTVSGKTFISAGTCYVRTAPRNPDRERLEQGACKSMQQFASHKRRRETGQKLVWGVSPGGECAFCNQLINPVIYKQLAMLLTEPILSHPRANWPMHKIPIHERILQDGSDCINVVLADGDRDVQAIWTLVVGCQVA